MDPGAYQFLQEASDDIDRIDFVCADTDAGWKEATHAFNNGYDVVVTDLFFDHSAVGVSSTPKRQPTITFRGFDLMEEGVFNAKAKGSNASFVVLTAWDHPDNIYETYRRNACAFVSRRHPLRVSDLLDSITQAAENRNTYPNMLPKVRNIAKALSHPSLNTFSMIELEIIDLLVNDCDTKQIKTAIGAASNASTRERIYQLVKKAGHNDRAELVDHALHLGLVKYESQENRS